MQRFYDVESYEHAYLKLKNADLDGKSNPMTGLSDEELENFHLFVLRKMKDPKYIHWTVKNILNIDLLPEQTVILQELWTNAFPMYIASRGFGKSFLLAVYATLRCLLIPGTKIVICGAAFRQSKVIFEYMDTIWKNAPILRSICGDNSGPRRDVDVCTLKINDSWTKAVPLGDGCLVRDTLITYGDSVDTISVEHDTDNPEEEIIDRKVNVWGNGKFRESDESYCNGVKPTKKIVTKKGYEIEGTLNHKIKVYNKFNKKIEWKRFDQICKGDHPIIDRSERWHEGTTDITYEEAYAVGLMIGDGCWTNPYHMSFATKDKELTDRLKEGTDFDWTLCSDEVHWKMNGKQKKRDWLAKFNLAPKSYAKDKVIPSSILSSSKWIMKACISALYDTDGHVSVNTSKGGTSIAIGFTNTSKKLVDQLHYLLLHFGIVSYKTSRDRDEKWETVYELLITGKDVRQFYQKINFGLTRKKEILEIALRDRVREVSAGDIIPGLIDTMVSVAKTHKRRGIPQVTASKISSRKEATRDLITDFCAKYINSEPVVQTIKDLNDPNIYYDEVISVEDGFAPTYDIHVPEEHEYCANGFYSHNTKIRGLRAHTIIADEFNCLDGNTLVETDNGLVRIGESLDYSNMMLRTGDDRLPYEKPDTYVVTQPVDCFEVKFDNGYVIRCSATHKLMTQNGWKTPLQLSKGDYVESDNQYIFPDNPVDFMDEKTAWLFGLLISEGSINDKSRISIKTTDLNLANKLKNEFGFSIHEREAYVDRRGWNCKKSYEVYLYDAKLRQHYLNLGLEFSTSHNKKIPSSILRSNKSCVYAFLEGLFEGDGSCFLYSDNKKVHNRLGVAYYSVSEILCRDVQVLLNKLGYDPYINKRKSDLSDNDQWFVRMNGIDAYNFASKMNIERFFNPVKNSYVPKKPLGYTWDKNRSKWKISKKYLGKTIQKRFDTEEEVIAEIKKIDGFKNFKKVVSVKKSKEKKVLYDYHLPVTHSFYAGGFRNHNSIPVEIYETVVAGFAAVSKDPTGNVKNAATRKAMKGDEVWTERHEELYQEKHENQSILSGTAGYDFEPYAGYWKKYKLTIKSKGDFKKLLGSDATDEDIEALPDYMKRIDYRKFSVMRIPYELIPEGFMDDQQVSRSRATMDSGTYLMEYGACFAKDSTGFFKRTLIESIVTSDKNISSPNWPTWCDAAFDVTTRGRTDKTYVFGIDPASEVDNFALVVMELWPQHQRLVYVWTTNRKDFNNRRKLGLTTTDDYYSFCVRKIRDLMRVFPCVRIGIDSQGGGYQIAEGLADKDKVREEMGEVPIYEVIDPDGKEKDTDRLSGMHILEFANFANAEWTSNANHGLRKDMEDKFILFPRFDNITLGMISKQDEIKFNELKNTVGDTSALKMYDTLEDCIMNIEELKTELSYILVTRTPSGREKFDTPEIKLDTGKKGRMKKDRYSALVIGNMIARSMAREIPPPIYHTIGQVANAKEKLPEGQMYYGQGWANVYDVSAVQVVNRNQY